MKKFISVAVVALAVSTSAFASGELPSRIYREIPAPAPVVVQRVGFFAKVGSYVKNRISDVKDVVFQTADGVVGVVGIDPAQDDVY